MGSTLNACLYELVILAVDDKQKIRTVMNKSGISTIGIYGLGLLGRAFYSVCVKNGISVLFGMDADDSKKIEGLSYAEPLESGLPKVDAIIVTPIKDRASIIASLSERHDARIIPITELLDELLIGISVQ